jgi:hypothetical protein
MTRAIDIHGVPREVLRAELAYLIGYLGERGHERCEVVFGWHWGMDYPPEKPWGTIPLSLSDLEAEVGKLEEAGLGTFGLDDVTIGIPPLQCEFLFCHHHGVHLTASGPAGIADDFHARWTSAGLNPGVGDGTPAS